MLQSQYKSVCQTESLIGKLCPIATYSGPVLPHEPEMVAEKWQDADEEQRRHEKQKQDVEFGVRVGQLFLQREKKKKQALALSVGMSSHL